MDLRALTIACLLAFPASEAGAVTIYTYQGSPFTEFTAPGLPAPPDAPFDTSMSITAELVFSDPLPSNSSVLAIDYLRAETGEVLSSIVHPSLLSFRLSNALFDAALADAADIGPGFLPSVHVALLTNTLGEIVDWSVFAFTANSPLGFLDELSSTPASDFARYARGEGVFTAWSNTPGLWIARTVVAPVPAPATITLLSMGLLLLFIFRHFSAARAATARP